MLALDTVWAFPKRRLARLVPARPTRHFIESAIFLLDRLESHEHISPYLGVRPLLGPRGSPCPGGSIGAAGDPLRFPDPGGNLARLPRWARRVWQGAHGLWKDARVRVGRPFPAGARGI